ncbi:hypothetical protein ISCGN_000099 [Ixodes scapularis]
MPPARQQIGCAQSGWEADAGPPNFSNQPSPVHRGQSSSDATEDGCDAVHLPSWHTPTWRPSLVCGPGTKKRLWATRTRLLTGRLVSLAGAALKWTHGQSNVYPCFCSDPRGLYGPWCCCRLQADVTDTAKSCCLT